MMSKHTYYHVFNFEDEYILFDYYNSVVFEISKSMYDYLNNHSTYKSDPVYSDEASSFKQLVNDGYLLSDEELDEQFEEESAYLSFAPAYKCNLRCRYCFAKYGSLYHGETREYTKESIVHMLDFFFLQAFPNKKSYRIDFVSGGEPLINFDVIRQTIDYCEDLIAKKNVNIKIWLCTNGTLLTDEICSYLDEHKVTIGISIDGAKNVHDANRIDALGNGTYERVVQSIRRIHQSKTLSNRFKGIWGLSVLNDQNMNLIDIVTHHRDIGLKDAQIKIERQVLNNEFDYSKHKEMYLALMKHFISEAVNGDCTKLRIILNEEDYLGKFLVRIITNQYTTMRCNAGKCKITICPNGDIYPCDSFVGIREMKLGNMLVSPDISKRMSKLTINECEPCKNCSIRYLCGGDCYYNSYINTGKVNVVHPKMCDMLRFLCELSVWGCYKLQKTAPDVYSKLQAEAILIEKVRHQI